MDEYIITIDLIDGRKIEGICCINNILEGDALLLCASSEAIMMLNVHDIKYSQVKSFDFYVYEKENN